MERISLQQLNADVQAAIRQAKETFPKFGPGVLICVADPRKNHFAEVELANQEQVSRLAVQLIDLGYELTMRKEDDCDFVLDRSDSESST